jgi:hypothetical protein
MPEELPVSDHDKLEKVHEAIFGDGNGNMGMKKKLDEMGDFHSGATLGRKLLRNLLITFATLCTALRYPDMYGSAPRSSTGPGLSPPQ